MSRNGPSRRWSGLIGSVGSRATTDTAKFPLPLSFFFLFHSHHRIAQFIARRRTIKESGIGGKNLHIDDFLVSSIVRCSLVI
jgi:hypothetical protein